MADGSTVDLAGMSRQELLTIQWNQERTFARQILAAPKGSPARAEATRRAYDTVPRIFAAVEGLDGAGPAMGYHPRQGRLVIARLARHRRRGLPARLFEIGYGNGALLKQVADAGFAVAGIEVAPTLCEQACRLLGPAHATELLVGDFLREEAVVAAAPFGVVYWNDVFEHIPPDEILDYLRRIHQMLATGGELVTITPNWHIRPSDVTADIAGPRAEAAGLHLKEYTLREVTRLLREAGFRRVAAPLAVTHQRIVLCGSGLASLKRLVEPGLERLPYRLARLLCRGMGLSTTIAVK
ncbi:MAG: class I SAM-dependent methyltransferase [Pirellulales bacterium]